MLGAYVCARVCDVCVCVCVCVCVSLYMCMWVLCECEREFSVEGENKYEWWGRMCVRASVMFVCVCVCVCVCQSICGFGCHVLKCICVCVSYECDSRPRAVRSKVEEQSRGCDLHFLGGLYS